MRGQRKQDGATDATITFTFESAYNRIVQPTHYVSLSQYFISHWMPGISPAGLKILLQLRSMGYYNPAQGVQRGDIDIEQKELAGLCGMSHSTLKRAFADDPILSAYVQRVFDTKRDPRNGRIIREHYLYVVKMDDVLIPADRALLEEMLRGPDKNSDKGDNQSEPPPSPPMGHSDPSGLPPIAQSEPSGVQSEPPMGHFERDPVQNDPPLKGTLITPITLNDSTTPAAHSDSLSLFESEEKTKPPAWPDLTEAERSPWLDRARQEIATGSVREVSAVNPALVETRARNLYRLSLKRQPA